MVEKKEVNGQAHQSPPKIDEGWWDSVMSDSTLNEVGPEPAMRAEMEYDLNLSNVDWDYVQELLETDAIVALTVYGYNRGGLLVEGENIQGFVPVSHLTRMSAVQDDSSRYELLVEYMHETLMLKVIECTPQQKRIVFSERAALAGEGKRNDLFASLKPGDLASGKVTNITAFGVFVDLGGVEGLIHISELSWGRVQQATNHVRIGDTIRVKVLQMNERNGRIALSLKQLQPNPWASIHQKYHIGDHTRATITSVTHFGAFARLQEGIEGLIHVSSFGQEQHKMQNSLAPGDSVTVKILHIDSERHRLGLGLVQME
ncbi:MAG: 30S ribosomal protein S1 [Anaerolineae bacterium]|nr:30S ribosomal protein S1 [Anaerolineae bacterium]